MTALLLALLAHNSADFLFQTKQMVRAKNRLKLSAFFVHALIFWITLLFLLQGYQYPNVFWFASVLAISHLIIDLAKCLIMRRGGKVLDLILFLGDQGLHLLAIWFCWQNFAFESNPTVASFYQMLFTPNFPLNLKPVPLPMLNHLLLAANLYIAVCAGGAILIRKILEVLAPKVETTEENVLEPEKIGSFIGVLERLLMLFLVTNNALGSVAFILTAKSVARFSELNDRKFAEYYLIGTLLSTGLAVLGGFFLNWVVLLI